MTAYRIYKVYRVHSVCQVIVMIGLRQRQEANCSTSRVRRWDKPSCAATTSLMNWQTSRQNCATSSKNSDLKRSPLKCTDHPRQMVGMVIFMGIRNLYFRSFCSKTHNGILRHEHTLICSTHSSRGAPPRLLLSITHLCAVHMREGLRSGDHTAGVRGRTG